jgi:hypothetical protein
LTISLTTSSVLSAGSVAAIETGVAPLALFKIKSLALPVAVLGAAITPVDNNREIPNTTGLINTDFQNADDIRVVLLTL